MDSRLRFAPGVLAHLGELLVPAADAALAELVKNAYDADASYCKIDIVGGQRRTQSITVLDDGDGMNRRAITDAWLIVGRSEKVHTDRTQVYHRVPLGEKGLGRLAALRLGRRVVLRTRPRSRAGVEFQLAINWDAFDKAKTVDDVRLAVRQATTPDPHGTTIVLSGLRHYLNADAIDSIAESLVLLQGPFSKPKQFRIEINSSRYGTLAAETGQDYLSDADFRLEARLSASGSADYSLLDWSGRKIAHSSRAKAKYKTSAATLELWTFLLGSNYSARDRAMSLRARGDWLRQFGGVYIFEGPLRVAPYGGHGEDWLGLNIARARSPEERPSTNNSVGRVLVDPARTRLVQKTDRIGFLDDEAFRELRRFCIDAVDWASKERLKRAEIRRARTRQQKATRVERAIADVKTVAETLPVHQRSTVQRAVQRLITTASEEADAVRGELQLYRSLATVGMTTSAFAHELQKPLGILKRTMPRVEKAAASDATLARYVQLVSNSIDRLAPYVRVPLGMLRRDRRRGGRVDAIAAIADLVTLFEPLLTAGGVVIEPLRSESGPFTRGTPSMIDAIFANLLANSFAAFERGGIARSRRRIRIATTIRGEVLLVKYADNAGGIKGVSTDDMWLPGVTTTAGGTGFGLTIVRDTIRDIGGAIRVERKSAFGGAEFSVELPIAAAR